MDEKMLFCFRVLPNHHLVWTSNDYLFLYDIEQGEIAASKKLVILSEVDQRLLKKLGIEVTTEPIRENTPAAEL